ncbi:MAG TPA: GAF domain-containing sensor histidine kinase [Gemmatimonadota bacterium]|jgi:signal transduction histidine kinase
MTLPQRILAHFSGGGSGQPGLQMDRVTGVLRIAFLILVLTVVGEPAALLRHPLASALLLAAYLGLIGALIAMASPSDEREETQRELLFTAELLILTGLVWLVGHDLPLVFTLFLFPLTGFFQPISIKRSLYVAVFLAGLYAGLVYIARMPADRSGVFGSLMLLVGGISLGYLGEKSRWSGTQLAMFRRCGEILKKDVSFDELLADLLREIALHYPVERVILVSAEADGGPGRLKQARRAGGEVLYEEIEFLREEVQYLFPLDLFSGFYINRLGRPDPDDAHYDFLEGRPMEVAVELPKIFATLFNVRSVLSSSILRQDRTLGRIFLINRTQGRFTEKDIHFLRQLCERHLRPVLENLQLMEKTQALAVLEERNRIAMDLHDSFIQTLASLDIRLEVSRRILEKDTSAGLEEMRRISQIVKSEHLELRRYMNKLRHHVPEAMKLEEQLEAFIQRFREDHGLPVEMTIAKSRGPLAESLRGEILQIAREGLTNVVRHAGATKATLAVDIGEEEVKIRIQDDGRGMPRVNGDGGPGTVIKPWTILQRTERLSGNVEVDSLPGEGTRISVSIPLRRTS